MNRHMFKLTLLLFICSITNISKAQDDIATAQDKDTSQQKESVSHDTQAGEDDPQKRAAELIEQFTVVSNLDPLNFICIPWSVDPSYEYYNSLNPIKRHHMEPKGDCNAVICELVSLGAQAVPLLVKHLDDDRETKITLKLREDPWFSSIVQLEVYDYNTNGKFKPAQELEKFAYRGSDKPVTNGHRLKVGDLCFTALGHIVNRRFFAASLPAYAGIEVTSPLLSPNILEASRAEWADLTVEQHKASLRFDALHPDGCGWGREGAVRRLVFYYPDVAEEVALKLLERPMYDGILTYKFAWSELGKTDDPAQWRKATIAFYEKYGQQYQQALHKQLVSDEYHERMTREGKIQYERRYVVDPQLIINTLFPKGLEFNGGVGIEDQAQIINNIYDLDSKSVDDRILKLFRALDRDAPPGILLDSFAISCIHKLEGKGLDEELKAYCRERIPKASETYSKQLKYWLDRLETTP